MIWDEDKFKQLVDAEEYLDFFKISYQQEIVNVNRLHILKKFSQYLEEIDENHSNLDLSGKLTYYREALGKAYQIFVESTPQEQKLFKVFHNKPKNVVMLTEITSD